MMIPENLQIFSEPTLIITSDFSKSKIYLAHELEINEIAATDAPPQSRPDSEGAVIGAGGRMMNPDSDIDQGVDRTKFSKDLAGTISKEIAKNNISDLQLIMPSEMLRRIQDDLPNENKDLVSKTIDKDLMKESLIDILERLHQIPKPIN
ncbi:host attachment protein [Patescibacteria group bacterium]|nr:host attachment protein [Patescibacteria group bacterium]